MAPDFSFDDPPVEYKLSTYKLKTPETEYDGFDDVNSGLKTLRVCANFFFMARKEKRIDFGVGATEAMLEMMGLLLTRAAHCSSQERTAMFERWVVDGPLQCAEVIRKVEDREVKVLMPDDFSAFLKCPRGY
jgi:hypothetical protein